MNAVESLTKQMFPGVVVVPVMSTGATDGLYLRNAEIPTYGIDGTFGDHRRCARARQGRARRREAVLRGPGVSVPVDQDAGRPPVAASTMAGHSLRARRPRNDVAAAGEIRSDPDVVGKFLEDAAHFPGGHAAGIASPANEGEVAAVLRSAASVLPIGAQSSLTGGATPMGELLLSTSRLNRILEIGDDSVRVEAGRDARSISTPRWHAPGSTIRRRRPSPARSSAASSRPTPPARRPSNTGRRATGCAAITVVLPGGDVLDVERGVTTADRDGTFEIVLPERTVASRGAALPHARGVPKVSAGYFAAPGMDLIDLFIGSEGTLGVITEVTLRVLPARPAMCLAFVPFDDRRAALGFVTRLRDAARETWRTRDPRGLDVSAIEHMDARCLALLREDGADRRFGVAIPAGRRDRAARHARAAARTRPPPTRSTRSAARASRTRPTRRSTRFCRALDEAGVLDRGRDRRARRSRARERSCSRCAKRCRPAVNARVGRAKHDVDPRIAKTAADMIVPFDRLERAADDLRRGVRAPRPRRRGLGPHLRRQPAPQRHPAIDRGRGVGQGGDPGVRPRSDPARADRRSPSTASGGIR